MIDVLVLGSGVAGLTTALEAARQGLSTVVLTKGELSLSATRYAQGGVAAALEAPDSWELHLADTLTAGAGLCDVEAVQVLVTEGPDRVRELAALGARFDTEPGPDGDQLLLAREGGHSLARVVHAGGDATGAEIERALVAAVENSVIEIREGWFAIELLMEGGRCTGVIALRPDGEVEFVRALVDIVLATGGVGQCFAVTTNPTLSTGDGVALALKAGAACADLEFVQFHPTALHHPSMPRPLLSEALRGEGAVLRDADGIAFMADVHPLADLAPRDVVARAIHQRMAATNAEHLWLDATMIDDFPNRFPTIWEACRTADLDPRRNWLPVAPAAHYLSGGVLADLDGASTVPHLWACGETACSGVHGANRLVSNSLLDGLVFGQRVVSAIVAGKVGPESTGAMAGALSLLPLEVEASSDPIVLRKEKVTAPDALRSAVQRTMSADCGVVRDAQSLERAAATLADLAALAEDLPAREMATYEVINVLRVSRMIVATALAWEESRGAHTRSDFPGAHDVWLGRLVVRGELEPQFVELPALAVERGNVSDYDVPASVVAEVVAVALAEDIGLLGDLTATALIREDQTASALLVAREEGVVAGTALVEETYRQVDDEIEVRWQFRDGDSVEAGAEIGEISGPLRSILTGERVALNFLCHCSGVATSTRRYVRAARGKVRILDTRKTLPGLRGVQRAAVRAGGGFNHRDSLSTAVLIKDNHLAALGLTKAVERARARWPMRLIEVECDTLDQVAEARDVGVDVALVDNMSPDDVRKAVEVLDGSAKVEVSGRVGLDMVGAYAETGADFISVGALTHSVRVFDIGLDIR